jgi:hypothetical protein
MFLVVGDLLLEEKLVALAVDLCEHIRRNRPILFVLSSNSRVSLTVPASV